MKKIMIGILVFVIIPGSCLADAIIYYKVKNIFHPVLDYNNPKPLIIDFEFQWGGRDVETERIIYTPMFYKHISIQNDKEYVMPESKVTYYDAYERPDNKGFVIFKKSTKYEGTEEFEEIQVCDISRQSYVFLESHGTKMYFTSDYKYLVSVLFPYTEGDPESSITLTLYYYELSKFYSLYNNKPVKQVEIKMPELSNCSLIELK